MQTQDERRAKLEAVKELARQQEHDAAQELLQAQDVGYTSKLFVQALFPYKQIEGNTYSIESGTVSYTHLTLPTICSV